MNIGERIRKIRELKGMKQDYLAEKLGMTQASYSKIESSDADIYISRLQKIAAVLEVSINEIVDFDKHSFFNLSHHSKGVVINNPNAQIAINEAELFDKINSLNTQVIESQAKTIEILERNIETLTKLLQEAIAKNK